MFFQDFMQKENTSFTVNKNNHQNKSINCSNGSISNNALNINKNQPTIVNLFQKKNNTTSEAITDTNNNVLSKGQKGKVIFFFN